MLYDYDLGGSESSCCHTSQTFFKNLQRIHDTIFFCEKKLFHLGKPIVILSVKYHANDFSSFGAVCIVFWSNKTNIELIGQNGNGSIYSQQRLPKENRPYRIKQWGKLITFWGSISAYGFGAFCWNHKEWRLFSDTAHLLEIISRKSAWQVGLRRH